MVCKDNKKTIHLHMKRIIVFTISLFLFFPLCAQYSVRGGDGIPLLAESRSGVDVYMLNRLAGSQITFTSANPGAHQWFRYKENTGDAVPVSSIQNGNTSLITDLQDGYGYFVGFPETIFHYVWIIDYSRYVPHFFNLEIVEEEDKCEQLKIIADVEAEAINFYLPSGAIANLQRVYHLIYNTLEWDEDSRMFNEKEINQEVKGLISEFSVEAPLENTAFTLSGDNYAEHFGLLQAIRSSEYEAIAVEAHGFPETDKKQADNEIYGRGGSPGESAPVEYTFTAYANEPVAAFFIWKIQKREDGTANLTDIIRYTDKVARYNFDKEGAYIAKLEVFDAKSVCVDTSQVFDIVVGKTYIKIPNAFSPGSSIGVNDEFKIAYTSITAFRASIFNRWGNLLFRWTDPSKGWDGRVNGKFVPTGTYYVIVEYTDSEGKKRSTSSDINILRSKE
jgi:gliding motility-associated-like protein